MNIIKAVLVVLSLVLCIVAPVAAGSAKDAAAVMKAAERGDAKAQFDLGSMYYDGSGVTKDNIQAYKWTSLAVSGFHASEKKVRDRAIDALNTIAKDMTPSQLVEAHRLVSEWKPTPAKK